MSTYSQILDNTFERMTHRELFNTHGSVGIAIFFILFFLCGAQHYTGYILPIDNMLIRKLAVIARVSKRPAQVRKIIEEMSSLGIIDPLLYKAGFIFMAEVYEGRRQYFMTIFNDNAKGERGKIINEWEFFYTYRVEKNPDFKDTNLEYLKDGQLKKIRNKHDFIEYIKFIMSKI